MKFNPDLIEFFKKHNMYESTMFDYLENHSTMIDYDYPEQRCLIGCFYITNHKGKLKELKLNLPYVNNEVTMLISVHELTHGIENYQKIGKTFKKDITIEALPLLYEKIYILEYPTDKLLQYAEYLDLIIDEETKKEYKFALKIREELLKQYNNQPQEMIKITKKLARVYHKEFK